jgi:hypothetical protein
MAWAVRAREGRWNGPAQVYYDALLMVHHINGGRPAFSLLQQLLRLRDWLRAALRCCAPGRVNRAPATVRALRVGVFT